MGLGAKALILGGGMGTRLRPLTDVLPKCLVPIGDRVLMDYWVECLIEAEVSEARINTHAHAECVRDHIAAINADGRLRMAESYEPTLLGSAGTVAANADLADDSDVIVIIYVDNLTDIDLRPLLAFHRQHDDPLTMALFRSPNPCACRIAELDGQRRITSFVAKPEQPTSNLADAGLYVVDAAAYREIAQMGAFDLSFDVLPRFAGRMSGWVWGGYYLNIGTHEALESARNDVDSKSVMTALNGHDLSRRAVFLDRDGTIIEHVHYLTDPDLVHILPGVIDALKRFRCAGYARVLVTNQSAIGRGMLTTERLEQIHTEMNRQLAAGGATIDATYFCPDVPVNDDRTIVENPDRKPGPGMLLRAAADLNLDLKASWMVGDLISDVLAGQNAGCRSILLESSQTAPEAAERFGGQYLTAPNLDAAADVILATRGER